MRNNADQIYSTSRQTDEQCRSPIMETLMRLTEAPICHFICSLRIIGIVRAQLSESHLRLVALAFHRSAMSAWKFSTICRRLCVSLWLLRLFVLVFSCKSIYSFCFPYYSFVCVFYKKFIVHKHDFKRSKEKMRLCLLTVARVTVYFIIFTK